MPRFLCLEYIIRRSCDVRACYLRLDYHEVIHYESYLIYTKLSKSYTGSSVFFYLPFGNYCL